MGKTLSNQPNDLSSCHQAPVTIGGRGDFDDKDRAVTQYYVCSKCNNPCDLFVTPNPEPKIDCIKCGRKDVPNWDGKGHCITCARDMMLGNPNPEQEIMALRAIWWLFGFLTAIGLHAIFGGNLL